MRVIKTISGLIPRGSFTLAAGGLAFVAVGLASCSSNVSRFDYPMFASADGQSDAALTTSSVNPVPAEPIYGGSANQTVQKSELPPARPYGGEPPSYGQNSAQPYGTTQQQPAQTQTAAVAPRQAAPMPLPPAQAKVPSPAPNPKRLTVTIKKGDTLGAIGRKYGVTPREIMIANGLSNTRLSIGQKLVIPGAEPVQAVASKATTYKVRSGDSLSIIARKHGLGYRDLAQHNGLKENVVLRPGQVLKIPGGKAAPVRVASRVSSVPMPNTNPARASAPVAPKKSAAKPSTTKSHVKKASLPSPKPMTGNQFRWPVRGRVISGFGAKPNGKHNDGINVAVPLGASVKAAENGVVAYAGSELEGYGNLILIRHANGWVSAYAHNDEILVKRGDEVRRGEVIAKAGKTGSVSQPQLHFELRKGSQPVDPLKYMASS